MGAAVCGWSVYWQIINDIDSRLSGSALKCQRGISVKETEGNAK